MTVPSLAQFLDLGGLLAFAFLVWTIMKEQTKILKTLSASVVRIETRQDTIMERQRTVADSVLHIDRNKPIPAGHDVHKLAQ